MSDIINLDSHRKDKFANKPVYDKIEDAIIRNRAMFQMVNNSAAWVLGLMAELTPEEYDEVEKDQYVKLHLSTGQAIYSLLLQTIKYKLLPAKMNFILFDDHNMVFDATAPFPRPLTIIKWTDLGICYTHSTMQWEENISIPPELYKKRGLNHALVKQVGYVKPDDFGKHRIPLRTLERLLDMFSEIAMMNGGGWEISTTEESYVMTCYLHSLEAENFLGVHKLEISRAHYVIEYEGLKINV